jgi:NADPH2:quinone reductase
MRAVVIARTGGVESLEVREMPAPEPRGEQVRVRVRAAGVNRADLMQARGHYPAPPGAPADVPGLEYAGEVEAIGPDCVGPWKLGDRVFGIVGGGGLAEFVVTHERLAVPIPRNLDFEQAAAVPEVFLTAHDALDTQANIRPGERVLIHTVGGGVGSAAVQIAHAMGCFTFGTSRSAEKLKLAQELGLDVGIDTSRGDFATVVRDHTAGEGVHVVIDQVGASAFDGNLASLASRGRLILVGLLGGTKTSFDLNVMLRKRLTIVGTTLRARPLEEKIAATTKFAATVVPWLERGLVRPVVDRVYALADIHAAQERMESNAGFGKIIVTL